MVLDNPRHWVEALQTLFHYHQSSRHVHGDIKPGNLLAKHLDGADGEVELVISDLEGAQPIGSPVTSVLSTMGYMPLSILTKYLEEQKQAGVANSLLRSVSPIVWDTAVDYWSFGVMVLKKFCPIYTRSKFRVVEVVAEVKEAMKKGPDEALQALDRLREIYA